MKNVILFSSPYSDKKLNNRVNDWLNKHGDNRSIAYFPSSYYSRATEMPPMTVANMGFDEYVTCPLGENFDEKRLELALSCSGAMISGGNTFELLFLLKARGLMEKLQDFASHSILMGYSAGAHVLCNNILCAGLADDNFLGLRQEDCAGLKLFDAMIKPHMDSCVELTPILKNMASIFNKTIYGIKEGQAIWHCDYGTRFYGGMPLMFNPK